MELLSAADREALANQTDNFGVTPLFLARQKWVHRGCRGVGSGDRALLQHGACRCSWRGKSGYTGGTGGSMGYVCRCSRHGQAGDPGDRESS